MGPGPAVFVIVSLISTAGAAQALPPLPPARPAFGPQGAGIGPGSQRSDPTAPAAPLPPVRPPQFGPDRPKRDAPPQAASQPLAPPPSGVAAPQPAAPTWVTSGQTIGNPPDDLVPGAFPVDQMDAACTRVLASGKIMGRRETSVVGPNGCGIAYPLTLQAVILKDGGQANFEPAPTLRCDLADTLADWVREDLAPLGQVKGRLTGLIDAAAYVCRGRNNVLGAPMSEHGRGDAIDILGLRFGSSPVMLGQPDSHEIWGSIKDGACRRFKTVLGPGSDGYHENNLHLDLENRRNGSHYCHWDHP